MSVPGTMVRPVYRLYQMAWTGLDWLFPPLCGGCGQNGSRWCSDCQQATRKISKSVCLICGRVLVRNTVCPSCRDAPPPYSAVRSWAVYGGPLRKAVHRLKYKGDISLAEILARPMLSLLCELPWTIDIVVPVPTSASRRAERGYNQAALLAYPLALGAGIPYRPRALDKVRQTNTQVGLSFLQRRANVAGAFLARAKHVYGKCVLVVDDIMTSGATMDECSRALIDAGATRVFGLTLAQAGFDLSAEPDLKDG